MPRCVLEVLSQNKNTVRVGGQPGQIGMETQMRGINAMTVRVYCEGHNSGMSDLDDELKAFYVATLATSLRPNEARPVTRIDGPKLELSLLKVAVGTLALKNGPEHVPRPWRQALVTRTIPLDWGLYVQRAPNREVTEKFGDFHVEIGLFVDPFKSTRTEMWGVPIGATFHTGPFGLILDACSPDAAVVNGVHHGAGWKVHKDGVQRTIGLRWPSQKISHWVELTLGKTHNVPAAGARSAPWKPVSGKKK